MKNTTLFYFINFIYMEFIFHLFFWKNVYILPIPAVAIAAIAAFLQSFFIGFLKGKAGKIFFWLFMVIDYLVFAVQMVYRAIFKQPLMIKAVFETGADALTQFWRETLQGIADAVGYKSPSAVKKRIDKIAAEYNNLVSAEYSDFLATHIK